ncbi:hypothetical protein AURDEDRAFT_74830 [Auricularia subglabra TFB-10046 SS5]|nr:hypothetical protein AURDEDRAFT_74830 [Auricularia subglabra TFB-10046 SS5]
MSPDFLARLILCGLIVNSVVRGANPLDRRAVQFQAASSINVTAILAAAVASQNAGNDVLATFPIRDGGPRINIYGDWLSLDGVSAFHYMADMDVDCDGADFQCDGNEDGQDETSFGHLAATHVPFYVVPVRFSQKQQNAGNLRPNAVGAIICNGKMFYGIFGDEDGDNPQVIGEASILLAQTCFPNDHLDGGKGHEPVDVEYIIFGTQVPSGVGDETIDISALKKLGDQQATLLQAALLSSGGNGGSGGGGGGGGDQCQTDDDCPGSKVCCVFGEVSRGSNV